MSAAYWILSGLLLLAAGMCLWAWLTGDPAPIRRTDHVPEHSRSNRDQDTRRLRPPPPAPDWRPYDERPGGRAPDWPPEP